MKKFLSIIAALLISVSGAWAETVTWTSGVSFSDGTTAGNFSSGWFSVVSPFSGTISSFTLNLGTNATTSAGARNDSYLAISRDLKSSTTGLTASDFVAISTNTCGMTDSKITMNFDNAELAGGVKYYFYFVAKENGTYTLKNQRYYVASSTLMSLGIVDHITADYTNYAIPFTSTMTLNSGKYYRIKGIKPTNLTDVYIISNSENADKLWKTENAPTVTNANYIWQATIDNGVILQNMGSSRYISKISGSQNGNNVNYLSATTLDDAERFILGDRSSFGRSKAGYVTLKSSTATSNSWLNCFTNQNWYVGSHNASPENGDPFFFIQVKKVTFTEAVAVNDGDAVSTIYLAVDGSESFSLPSSKLYSINGATAVTNTEAAATIATAGTSDITVSVSDNPTRNVTYTLNWSDGTQLLQVTDVTANLNASASEFLPSEMVNDCVTLSYSPETITNETTEVVVTATWNGPFQLSDSYASAKWYTVGIHSAHEDANHIWKYDSDNSGIIATEAVATNAYASLSDKNYFCFVGNPYDGLSIYNKAAGSGMTLYKSTTNGEHAKMASTGSLFIPGASSESSKTIANGYACFILKDGTVRLNCYDSDSYNVNGWTDSGNGSTCWFKTPSSYPYNFLSTLGLNAPAGAVGTKAVANDVLSAGNDLKNYFADNPFYFATASMVEMNMVLQTLNKLSAASEIALGEGYYRVISAVPGFNAAAAWYYNPAVSTTNIVWAKAATTAEHQVNSIFKFNANEDKWNIYSPNAQQSMATGNGTWNVQNAALGDAAAVEITSIGAAQYTFKQSGNDQTLHAGGHGNGTGSNGNLITWNANGQGEASAWYIVPVSTFDFSLNQIGNDYYATSCLPFDYTLTGATAYTLTLNEAKTTLQMTALEGGVVPAGTPVVIKGSANTATATIASDASTSAPLTTTSLTGIYVPTAVLAANNYFLGRNNNEPGFYKWGGSESLNLAANRAYLTISTGSSSNGFKLTFEDDDDVTGIESAINGQSSMVNGQSYYDLTGRKVANPQKGQIYIQNGKKVLF